MVYWAAPDSEGRRLERKHIFAINAEPAFLDVVRELLQMERFNVTTTTYVPRTFDAILGFAPDLIMLDLILGERAGWDLLERLSTDALTRAIPVIVTSPQQSLLDRAHVAFRAFGDRQFMIVPLELDALLAAVHGFIGDA